jgi:hypothetical protein
MVRLVRLMSNLIMIKQSGLVWNRPLPLRAMLPAVPGVIINMTVIIVNRLKRPRPKPTAVQKRKTSQNQGAVPVRNVGMKVAVLINSRSLIIKKKGEP